MLKGRVYGSFALTLLVGCTTADHSPDMVTDASAISDTIDAASDSHWPTDLASRDQPDVQDASGEQNTSNALDAPNAPDAPNALDAPELPACAPVTRIPRVCAAGEVRITSAVSLVGGADPGCVSALLSPGGQMDSTDMSGTYELCATPDVYSLSFKKGLYEEVIPAVGAVPGTNGQIPGASVASLSPIEIQRGHRMVSGPTGGHQISPDGHNILIAVLDATFSTSGSLYLSKDGATAKLLDQGGFLNGGQPYLSFTPDSSLGLWTNQNADLMAVNTRTLLVSKLAVNTDVNNPPIITKDGAFVVFVSNGALFSYAFGSGQTTFLGRLAQPETWAWSLTSDEKFVVFLGAAQTAQPYDLEYCPLGVSAPTQISSGVGHFPTFSPDGSSFVFYPGDQSQLWLGSIGKPPRQIATSYNAFVFSPDGKKIAYSDWTTHSIKVVDVADTTVTTIPGDLDKYFAFSPDGNWILDLSGTTFQEVPLAGGVPVVLEEQVDSNANVIFSPDGGLAVFWAKSSSGAVAPPCNGCDRTVYRLEIANVRTPSRATALPDDEAIGSYVHAGAFYAFSKDGSQFAYAVSENLGLGGLLNLHIHSFSSGAETFFESGVTSIGLSPSSSRIPYFVGTTLKIARFSAMGVSTLTIGSGVTESHVIFSPDELLVAFSQNGFLSIGSTDAGWSLPVLGNPEVARTAGVGGGQPTQWIGSQALIAIRSGSPTPYEFQNGSYFLPLR